MMKSTPSAHFERLLFPIAMVATAAIAAAQGWSEKIRAGETFCEQKWRRADDGRLEVFFCADTGLPEDGRYLPLVEAGGSLSAFQNCGMIGWLSLFCHGDGDLLAMTDAGFHFGALGIDAQDATLRQFVAVGAAAGSASADAAAPAAQRAALLDRLLAVDTLRRRGCKAALPEFDAVAAAADAPAELRERARAAAALLRDGTMTPRTRLDPATLELPLVADATIVIDHARLPDLGWLTAVGRRLGMATTARILDQAGGRMNTAIVSKAQTMADLVSELPFEVARSYGNMRLDQSCVALSLRAELETPVVLAWTAAGVFDAGLQRAATELNAELAGGRMFPRAQIEFAPATMSLRSDDSRGKPRPDAARLLLEDTGAAIRVQVPANSKVLATMAALRLPPVLGVDLRVTFGAAAAIELRVTARDEDGADAWVERGRQQLALLREHMPPALQKIVDRSKAAKALADAVLGAQLTTADAVAIGRVQFAGIDRQAIADLLLLLVD